MIGGIILKLEVLVTSIVTLLGAGFGSWIAIKGDFNLYTKQTKFHEIKTNFILKRNLRGIHQKLGSLIFLSGAMEEGKTNIKYMDMEDFMVLSIISKCESAQSMCREVIAIIDKEIQK